MPITINGAGTIAGISVGGLEDGIVTPAELSTGAPSWDAQYNLTNVASLNGGPLAGFRNRIINGDMRIDQRYSGSALTPVTSPSGSYVVDRWYVTQELGNSWTLQQNRNSVTPPTGFTNYFGIQVNSASTPATGSYNALGHAIEGFNISSLGWGSALAQSVTLSFWVRSSVTGQHGGSVRNGAATFVSYPFSYTISAANTWEYKTVTIPGPTTGTFATDNSAGINIFFDLGCGSTGRGTAGSWATQNVWGATGDVNVISTASATFFLTGVQLEPGPVATPFERRPIGTELALCQRYYEVKTGRVVTSGKTSAQDYVQWAFKVTKRATPTVVAGGTSTWSAVDGVTIDGISVISAVSTAAVIDTGTTASAEL